MTSAASASVAPTRHRGRAPWLGAAALALLVVSCSSESDEPSPAPSAQQDLSCQVSYENFAGPFVLNWCVGCHSSALAEEQRQGAPLGIDFDSLDGIRSHAARMHTVVVDAPRMPPLGGPSSEERELFGTWLDCGAKSSGAGFDPAPPPAPPLMEPLPAGMCAMERAPLPDAALPRCEKRTLDCIVACGTTVPENEAEACRNACVAADATPALLGVDCRACNLVQIFACLDAGGCRAETDALACCAEGCAGDDACVAERCDGKLQAFGLCAYYLAPDCLDFGQGPLSTCFAKD